MRRTKSENVATFGVGLLVIAVMMLFMVLIGPRERWDYILASLVVSVIIALLVTDKVNKL
jgi:predicted ABC-type sugar transport system permease subunit